MKRFTETTKWDDPWFRELPTPLKCFWMYLCDKCDASGVWVVDLKAAEFHIGEKIPLDKVAETFGQRIEKVAGRSGEAWRVVKFVAFQFPNLSRECKPHKQVFEALKRNNLDEETVRFGKPSAKVSARYAEGSPNLQVKEKEEEKEKEGGVGEKMNRFEKPTLDMVKLAMAKAGLPDSEAERFINYYESNGWRVGKNPMRKWTGAVGTWAANYRTNRFNSNGQPSPTPPTPKTKEQLDREMLLEAMR